MERMIAVLGVSAATLLLVAGIVFGLNDRQVFVTPPDGVAEQFMRKLVTKRYDVATDHLSDRLRKEVRPEHLRAAMEQLRRRVGRIDDVRGEPRSMQAGKAEAAAVLKTQGGKEVPVRLALVRKNGAWVVDDLGDLTPQSAAAKP